MIDGILLHIIFLIILVTKIYILRLRNQNQYARSSGSADHSFINFCPEAAGKFIHKITTPGRKTYRTEGDS